MKSGRHGNTLLVELLIVILFFMLACTVLLQVFASARRQSARAEVLAAAVAKAQNAADTLYGASDAENALFQLGFDRTEDGFTLACEGFTLTAQAETQKTRFGLWLQREVRALSPEGEILLALPCSRYAEVDP